MMIDAHIHFNHYSEDDRNEILRELHIHTIDAIISVSTDLASSIKTLELALKDSRIQPAFGFHPEQEIPSTQEVDSLLTWMENHVQEMVAVGEVGLPYYTKLERNGELDYTRYIQLLERFIQFAARYDKPIVLHAVYEDATIACDLLEKHGVKHAHFHWFKGDQSVVERMMTNSYYISITPDVLYEEEIQQLVMTYPLELMMIETDGPWPFEGPFKEMRTEPKMMKKSVMEIARLLERPVDEVSMILYENTKRFYRI